MKFCPNCGAKLDEGVKFCMECGTKIAASEPVCAPPAEPVYAPPAPPEPPVYEPPAPPAPEPPAKPSYTPQPPAKGGAGPEKKPKEKKPANRKWILFVGIGAAVILLAVLMIIFLGGGNKEELGVYAAVSCETDGGSVDVSGEWIELKKGGKATVFVTGREFSCKWSTDGKRFTLKQGGDTYRGDLESGVLNVNLAGASYTFVKKLNGDTYKAFSCISGGEILDEDLMDMIGGCYVVLGEKGEGVLYLFGEQAAITYDKKNLRLDGQSMPYEIKGDTMAFTYPDGSVFELKKTEEDPGMGDLADNGWEGGKWEVEDMLPALEIFLDWPGKELKDLEVSQASLSMDAEWGNATAWLNMDGEVESLNLYIYDVSFEDLREMLADRYGEPTDEGEEPYAESNGGAVNYCWFEHPAGTMKLASASEYDFIQIMINSK